MKPWLGLLATLVLPSLNAPLTLSLPARPEGHPKGGQVLPSEVVRQIVAPKKLLFSDRCGTTLRGFEDPVRVYDVNWRD